MIGPLHPLEREGLLIADAIRESSFLAYCEGSYSPTTKLSSQGWVLAKQTTTLWKGAGPVDGHKDLSSTHRAELGGFVAILHILITICTFHSITDGNIIIYGDCLSVINKIQRTTYGHLHDYLIANYDLLNKGRILLSKLKNVILVTVTWVKGHYNGKEKSTPRVRNDIAHNLANDYLHQVMGYFNPSSTVLEPPSSLVSILFDKSSITSNMERIIRKEYTTKTYKIRFAKRKNGP